MLEYDSGPNSHRLWHEKVANCPQRVGSMILQPKIVGWSTSKQKLAFDIKVILVWDLFSSYICGFRALCVNFSTNWFSVSSNSPALPYWAVLLCKQQLWNADINSCRPEAFLRMCKIYRERAYSYLFSTFSSFFSHSSKCASLKKDCFKLSLLEWGLL